MTTRKERQARTRELLMESAATVAARRVTRSEAAVVAEGSIREIIAVSTCFISNSAKLAPRQRRTPPPNGIQV